MVVKRLAHLGALFHQRQQRLNLADRNLLAFQFCALLGFFAGECGELAAILRHLADQELLAHPGLFGARALGRHEARFGIALAPKGRRQSRDVGLRRHQIALLVAEIRLVHGRVQLDQDIADLHFLPIADQDGANHADLERLHDLRMSGRDDLAFGDGDNIDVAEPGPNQRERKDGDDAVGPETADGRRRCFDDFQRGRQKFALGVAHRLVSDRDDGCGHRALIGWICPDQDCMACSAE